MVINDLKQVCPQCRGMKFQAGISRLGISEPNVGGKCPTCAGRGFLLTDLGRDLVELLQPLVAEMFEEWAKARDRGTSAGGSAAKDKTGGET